MEGTQTVTETFNVVFESADGDTEKFSIKQPRPNMTTDTTLALLNVAKATVTGGGTLVQTSGQKDIVKIKESYYEVVTKRWVDEKAE